MKKFKWFLSAALLFLFLSLSMIFFINEADSRAGGGHSYGGGSRSSGSSSRRTSGGSSHSSRSNTNSGSYNYHRSYSSHYRSSSNSECGCACCFFIFFIIIVIVLIMVYRKKSGQAAITGQSEPPVFSDKHSVSEEISAFKKLDANFSRPLFIDYIQILYARYQTARGDKSWAGLFPFIMRELLQNESLNSHSVTKVDQIVIGSSDISHIDTKLPDIDRITVDFETNYTEHLDEESKPTKNDIIYYSNETWCFERKKGVLSKGPEEISTLNCPSCGSPEETNADGTCPHCANVVNKGDFHWLVTSIRVKEKYPRPPLELSMSGGQEVGSDFPTIISHDFYAEKRVFMERYPNFSWEAFEEKIKNTFMSIQEAWSTCKWEKARAFETEHLFASHQYWIERYKAQNLRNTLEDINIHKVEIVKIEPDAFFESITARIWASMKDYTIDSEGRIIDGSKDTTRTFSEYWTFIRRAGFAEGLRDIKEGRCPNCGAELQVNMSGICEFCSSKISSGEFDWVVSMIEQDEAYTG